jgi:hypothetical protein
MKTHMWMTTLLALGACTIFTAQAQAQVAFAVEGRVGVTFPTGDFADADAEAGLGLGAELQANFHPNLTAYAGVHRYGFNCGSGCDLGDSPRVVTLGGGLKYIFHSPGDVYVWGRGGIVAGQFSTDSGSGDRNLGFELGFGADMPIAARTYLVPHAGFVSHDAGGGATARFVTAGVGLHYHF